MSRLAAAAAAVAVAVAVAFSLPLAAAADPPRAEGRIASDEGRAEILGSPVRVGERIDLPEGWYRVEEAGPEDEEVGSFSVVPAESLAAAGAPAWGPAMAAEDAADRRPAPRECLAERSAYFAELWRQSGIEVSSPVALLEGLEGKRGGSDTGFHWFAIATDAFRPLAWSSALRDRAEALVRCVRGG
jgi:hypothetical protein